jgi:hypothetical protein
MATLPAYVKVGFPLGEEPTSVVMRSEMDRGVAKQRRIAADTVVTEEVTLHFVTKQNSIDFETWVKTDIDAGTSFFDWVDLRTGATLQARIVEGKLGALTPATVNWAYSQRKVKLEWVRAAI